MADIHLQVDGLKEFQNDMRAGAEQIKPQVRWAMVQSVNTVKNHAQRIVAYKTGTLRRSIFTDVQNDGFKGIVAQDSDIASYGTGIEYGTKPHDIVPKNKQALFWKGALNPYKRVHHPGSAARPFMRPALEDNLEAIKDFFNQALLKVVLRMAGK